MPCISESKHNSKRSPTVNGVVWKRGGAKPFDGLDKEELQQELRTRIRNHSLHRQSLAPSMTMKKKELKAEFTIVKKGISNFPALATSSPNASLADLHIAEYEVAPTEPLHDFKGHMANVIWEVRIITNGSTKEEVEKFYLITLKDTVRGVDYRKATILLSNAFEKVCTNSSFACSILHCSSNW